MLTTRTIHTGFVGTLFLGAAFILVFFHARPTFQLLSELKTQVVDLSSEVAVIATPAEELSATGELTEVEQKDLSLAIPQYLEQDQILLDLNRAAIAADVSFSALTFSLDQNAALPTVHISGGFQGTPENIVRFLKMLEVNPRKFVVKDAGVARTDIVEGLALVTLSTTLESFYRYGE